MIHTHTEEGTQLWFDVERRYKTIFYRYVASTRELWFDVERRYKTIFAKRQTQRAGCGLM